MTSLIWQTPGECCIVVNVVADTTKNGTNFRRGEGICKIGLNFFVRVQGDAFALCNIEMSYFVADTTLSKTSAASLNLKTKMALSTKNVVLIAKWSL